MIAASKLELEYRHIVAEFAPYNVKTVQIIPKSDSINWTVIVVYKSNEYVRFDGELDKILKVALDYVRNQYRVTQEV